MERTAVVKRKTSETEIEMDLNLDGEGKYDLSTNIPFLDHMLAQLAKHGLFDLKIKAKGDVEIDFHHTVEDVGIVVGEAFKKALKDKKGIRRFGSAYTPLDEALALVVVDIAGRPYFVYDVDLPKEKVGEFDVELVEDFFQAFANNCGATLHVRMISGNNLHHIVEAIFKAFAKAMDQGTRIDKRIKDIPSTKGVL
ncbi:MAG: imidazoleglycerol-phosphate dehydratase HisB [Nitrospinota bacterium]|nr:imidazoleglycerol-phosphate dehydratase HisB [Nitrospinota bacterium]MDP7581274.1 imidazoleglycerol-phosphate dehydratase HisB [Nitrospinota bacterium]HJN02628.1 imidazoleglycerol-phosphate dehydratase HisB [Nitrospinota bacterium]